MGVDLQVLRFLLRSKTSVSFESFLMLGRQFCHVSQRDIEKELRHIHLNPADIRAAATKARESRYVEPILELLGARRVDSLDFSNYEQATIVHDINDPVPQNLKNRFSCVFDGGTLEHVFDFPRAMRNAMEMVAVGGHFMGVGPADNYSGHGFYQFSPELYFCIFSEKNGYEVEEVAVAESCRDAPCYRITDPAKLGRRVQFTTSRPTYVMVRAKRLRQAEIFRTPPQQPFYEAAWTSGAVTGNWQGMTTGKESLRSWAKRCLPEPVKRVLRPFAPQIRPLRSSGFEKI